MLVVTNVHPPWHSTKVKAESYHTTGLFGLPQGRRYERMFLNKTWSFPESILNKEVPRFWRLFNTQGMYTSRQDGFVWSVKFFR